MARSIAERQRNTNHCGNAAVVDVRGYSARHAVGRIAAARGSSIWRVDRVRRRKTGVTAAGYSGQFSGIRHREERLRDYVGAFVLAGLDPQVGAEAAFFADRVQSYNEGMKDREKIREDLKRYDSRWPGRKFWLAGDIKVEPQTDKRVRVTFPLRYELRNGSKHSSGKVDKTLVLERAGNDLQIVAVNERRAK